MATHDLTAARLRELLHYDASTGIFTWMKRPLSMFRDLRACAAWNGRYAGQTAGGISNGYVSIGVFDRAHWAHRLAWLYVHDEWPEHEIDHINGIRTDNRMQNLRDVRRVVNQQNVYSVSRGQKMPMGVFCNKRKRERAYSANIRIQGKTKHLGYFETAEMASQAYIAAKRLHHAGCTI
ncbi:HNH endonuclease signature motif containing protein [Xenophilus sp. Marseille-Q4582]|uniref:HNH endonuclease signature motif containing protein n=1 Tax=Xenophilus sp. Marseille-Q4582 TaxID=2866600 RepID=UPI001CE3DAE9|nr:HNH endonuclease signature motif containing protein [Xenophilus sp. Marseille-Q4582]